MPTYQYRCAQCGKFEVFQKITDDALENCPNCTGPVKRIIGKNIGVVFKGSGYYCKDYSSFSRKPLPERERNDEPSEAVNELADSTLEGTKDKVSDGHSDADKAS